MEVNLIADRKDYSIYETNKFKFKIADDKLERLQEKDNYHNKLMSLIMKNIKLTAKQSTGAEWEASVKAIFEEITQ